MSNEMVEINTKLLMDKQDFEDLQAKAKRADLKFSAYVVDVLLEKLGKQSKPGAGGEKGRKLAAVHEKWKDYFQDVPLAKRLPLNPNMFDPVGLQTHRTMVNVPVNESRRMTFTSEVENYLKEQGAGTKWPEIKLWVDEHADNFEGWEQDPARFMMVCIETLYNRANPE